ncbi:MAG: minor capsid protein, partial [Tissierellia bacterium]|nr:minor capsid protein [Tissierellia bacterium]
TPDIEKQLNMASRRVRISRLQAMELEMRKTVAGLMSREEKALFVHLGQTYKRSHMDMLEDLKRITGVDTISGIDKKKLEAIIHHPWAPDGKDFSQRIWGRGDKLVNTLRQELTQGMISERPTKETIERIQHKMGSSYKDAARLVRTETTAFKIKGDIDAFREMGVEEYQILATLDTRTTIICRSMDKKIVSIKDYQPGTTAPPFHPNCRTVIIPHFGDDIEKRLDTTRMARDPKTGKSGRVENMDYKKWVKKNKLTPKTKGYNKHKGSKNDEKTIDITVFKDAINEALEYGKKTGNECLLWMDKKGEKLFDTATGNSNSVAISPEVLEYLEKSKKNTIVSLHNHPGSSSFSPEDISILSSYESIDWMLVTGHDGTKYYLKINEGERLSYGELKHEYNKIKNELQPKYQKIFDKTGDSHYAWKEHSNETISKMAEKYNWIYRRDLNE